jgi:glutathione synthase/RimK-type ligase-like ATP-grasp enzyme
MKVRIATCKTLPEVDVDEAPLALAFAAAKVDAELVAWDDPSVDWDLPIPTLLRSTWNYALDVAGFLSWIDRVAVAAPLWNPREVVHSNVHKRYLLELAARGVGVVPTTLIERGNTCDLAELAKRYGTAKLVIKPEVGAGSLGTRVFTIGGPMTNPTPRGHLAALTSRGAALVQPYINSVDGYGERSLVWIDGSLSHAIRKKPRFVGDIERIEGPMPIADDERELAEAALAPVAHQILYGRVDMARDDENRPVVMELELVEPSLFLARQPGAADRLVAALCKRLT